MGKEAEVGHRVSDFLNGKPTFCVQLPARSKCVGSGVEKFDDIRIVHQSKFTAMQRKNLWQLLHECFVVPPNFGRCIFSRVGVFWSFCHFV